MYTKLDTQPGPGTKIKESEKSETIRQENCQCTCNSATETPEEPDGVIVAKNFTATQLSVDAAVGGG